MKKNQGAPVAYSVKELHKKKNLAQLEHRGQTFMLWQDEKDNWLYQVNKKEAVSTQQKELQFALNQAYEAIGEQLERHLGTPFIPRKAIYEGTRR